MDVQAAADGFHIRLGHEAGGEAMGPGHGLDRLLEEDRVIGRIAGIGLMMQISLELTWRIFLAGGGERYARKRRRLAQATR